VPSSLEKLSTNRVKLTIEMPFDELKPSLDKAYKDIANQVNVPGFRKGKVPAPVIDQRFGRGVVLQEAINDALPAAYGKAIEENTVVPLGQPEIEVTKLEDGEVVEFTAEVDVRPDFDLPDVSAISVEVPAVEVPDEDVDEPRPSQTDDDNDEDEHESRCRSDEDVDEGAQHRAHGDRHGDGADEQRSTRR